MAHSYSHLYGLPTTGLRFFTVYGPWGVGYGAVQIHQGHIGGESIDVYITTVKCTVTLLYIDDIAEAIVRPGGYSAGGSVMGPLNRIAGDQFRTVSCL